MNTRRMPLGLWAGVCSVLASAASAQANLITNGGFETGSLANWTVTNPPNSTVGVTNTQSRTAGTYALAWNGGNILGQSSIAQSFATIPGQRYVLQFDYGVFGATQTQQMIATVQGLGTPLNQTVSGMGPGGTNDTTWTRYYYPFVADSALTTLTFRDNTTLAQSNAADGNLDEVMVLAAGPGIVSPGGAGAIGTVRFQSGNIALGGVATQTDNYGGTLPNRAIDGNTNGWWGANSTTHTNSVGPGVFWQVDLGGEYAIQNVTLFNRSDACQDRLVEFTVNLLNPATGANVLNPFDLGIPNNVSSNLDGVADNGANAAQSYPQYGLRVNFVPNTVGRVVRVEQLAACHLSLAEVQAWGLANYIQPASDILMIEIAGAALFDVVNVTNQAVLNGLLEVSLLGGYAPPVGHTFNVLTAQTINLGSGFRVDGNFLHAVITDPQSGLQALQLTYVPEPGTLALLAIGGLGILRRRPRGMATGA